MAETPMHTNNIQSKHSDRAIQSDYMVSQHTLCFQASHAQSSAPMAKE